MSIYSVEIKKTDDSDPVELDFEIPDEVGTYQLKATDTNGKNIPVGGNFVVDKESHLYQLELKMSDGKSIFSNLFTVIGIAGGIEFPFQKVLYVLPSEEADTSNCFANERVSFYFGDDYYSIEYANRWEYNDFYSQFVQDLYNTGNTITSYDFSVLFLFVNYPNFENIDDFISIFDHIKEEMMNLYGHESNTFLFSKRLEYNNTLSGIVDGWFNIGTRALKDFLSGNNNPDDFKEYVINENLNNGYTGPFYIVCNPDCEINNQRINMKSFLSESYDDRIKEFSQQAVYDDVYISDFIYDGSAWQAEGSLIELAIGDLCNGAGSGLVISWEMFTQAYYMDEPLWRYILSQSAEYGDCYTILIIIPDVPESPYNNQIFQEIMAEYETHAIKILYAVPYVDKDSLRNVFESYLAKNKNQYDYQEDSESVIALTDTNILTFGWR